MDGHKECQWMTSYLHSDWSIISYEPLWLAEVSLCIFVIVNGVTISRLFPDNKLGFYPPWHSATLSYGGVKMGNQLEQTQQPHIHEILNILNVMFTIMTRWRKNKSETLSKDVFKVWRRETLMSFSPSQIWYEYAHAWLKEKHSLRSSVIHFAGK